MVLLFEKMLTWDASLYKFQQLLSLYEYKEFELQTSPLDPKKFLILFLNQLLPRPSSYSCKCFITISAKESG